MAEKAKYFSTLPRFYCPASSNSQLSAHSVHTTKWLWNTVTSFSSLDTKHGCSINREIHTVWRLSCNLSSLHLIFQKWWVWCGRYGWNKQFMNLQNKPQHRSQHWFLSLCESFCFSKWSLNFELALRWINPIDWLLTQFAMIWRKKRKKEITCSYTVDMLTC